jgi:hypothetical protein
MKGNREEPGVHIGEERKHTMPGINHTNVCYYHRFSEYWE